MKYNSAVKSSEGPTQATTWMSPENMMPEEDRRKRPHSTGFQPHEMPHTGKPTKTDTQISSGRGWGGGAGEEAKPLNGDRVSYRGDGMFWN